VNYLHHYNSLIDRAKKRTLEGYVEKHHILPRCMGGTDEVVNLVSLTPEEHFVAHQLLVKIYPNVPGLIYGLTRLSGGKSTLRSNKLYGWIRRRLSTQRSIDMKGHTIWVGRKHSESSKEKIRLYNLEKSHSRGRVQSKESKLKISIAKSGIKKPKLECPHCGLLSAAHIAYTYHFDSCKMINKSNILP